MTTPSGYATTRALLRALARGGTLDELAAACGLSRRRVLGRLREIEDAGDPIDRPPARGRGAEPGIYRLRHPARVVGGGR